MSSALTDEGTTSKSNVGVGIDRTGPDWHPHSNNNNVIVRLICYTPIDGS